MTSDFEAAIQTASDTVKEKVCLQKKLFSLKEKWATSERTLLAIDEMREAVRGIASAIQRQIDRRKEQLVVKDMREVIPTTAYRAYWKGYLKAKEEDKKLLVGSSPSTSKEEVKE